MNIFLDIDGVMVATKIWQLPELLDDGFLAFSSNATKVIQKIISEDTTIILTTSHKAKYTIEEWKNIFHKRGIFINNLKSLDENTTHLSRKDEILNWFDKNDSNENFIIIDDDKSLNDLPIFLKNRLISTNTMIGLTNNHLNEIKTLINL